MLPQLSIIIPSFRCEKLLKLTLDGLLEQTVEFSRFEVIVVDYDTYPYVPTQTLCTAADYRALTLKVIHQSVAGVSAARNCGVQVASATLVGFLEDDEKPAPYWVERALEVSNTAAADIFGGPCHLYYPTLPARSLEKDSNNEIFAKPVWFKDQYLIRSHGSVKTWLQAGQYLFGGNLFFQRAWWDRLKGFPTDFHRRGDENVRGDEMEIQYHAYQMGARILYDPDLYVLNYAHPGRQTPDWFLKSAWKTGQAQSRIAALNPSAVGYSLKTILKDLKNIIRDGWLVATAYLGMPLRNRSAYPFSSCYLIEKVAPVIENFSNSWFAMGYGLRKPSSRG